MTSSSKTPSCASCNSLTLSRTMSLTLLSDSLIANSMNFEAEATVNLMHWVRGTFDCGGITGEIRQRIGRFINNGIGTRFQQIEIQTQISCLCRQFPDNKGEEKLYWRDWEQRLSELIRWLHSASLGPWREFHQSAGRDSRLLFDGKYCLARQRRYVCTFGLPPNLFSDESEGDYGLQESENKVRCVWNEMFRVMEDWIDCKNCILSNVWMTVFLKLSARLYISIEIQDRRELEEGGAQGVPVLEVCKEIEGSFHRHIHSDVEDRSE